MHEPGEASSRQESTKYVRLQRGSAVGVGFSKPIGTERAGCRVRYGWVKAVHVAPDLVITVADFVAETKVDGQVLFDLPVVLNEHLGLLQTHTIFRRDARAPVLSVAEEEVSVLFARLRIG